MPVRVLVVDHHDSYTWNLVHLIAAVAGDLPDVVEHDGEFAPQGYSHIVLSPGPGHPADPADFALGRAVFELGVPVLGVCLGMQALVHQLGGRVARIEPAHGEVVRVDHDGTGPFQGVPAGFDAVRYHSLAAVQVAGPLREVAWCGGTGERVVMGVVHRELPLWGVQFHPESILTTYGDRLIANFLELR